MQFVKRNGNLLILTLIIVTGTLLRFWHFSKIPFTHDEFSALFRTHFDNFSELIEKGVKVDGHPAGIQVFLYYWTHFFGYSETIVKLPFLVVGILSLIVVYGIGKEWFNETVGLISSSFMASIQYTIMYSQIARPYASGLFFCLIMVYFWSKVIFKPEKKFMLYLVLYTLSSELCLYNHYFSFLFAIIVGFSGLFFISRKFILKYIMAGIFIILLFIPYLKIFVYQLGMSGIGDWLQKPNPGFLINYLKFIFQFSVYPILIAIIISIYGFYKFEKKELKISFLILSGIWFLLPFLVGYFYSVFVNSVLQYSVLIFSFPFLLFVFFGHLKPQNSWINLGIVSLILVTNSLALIYQRKHYKLFYNSVYEGLVNDYQIVKNPETIAIIDSHAEISKYYIAKDRIDTGLTYFSSLKDEKGLITYLSGNYQRYKQLFLGTVSGSNPVLVPIIMDYFPELKWQKNYLGGTSYMFSRSVNSSKKVISRLNFEQKANYWTSLDDTKIINASAVNNTYLIDNLNEWSPTFDRPLDEIIANKNNFIDISLKVYKPDSGCQAVLVSSIRSGDKEIYWDGRNFQSFLDNRISEKDWIRIHQSIKLSDINLDYNNLSLKVYVWNKGKEKLIIDDFEISLRAGNPVVYGLIEKI